MFFIKRAFCATYDPIWSDISPIRYLTNNFWKFSVADFFIFVDGFSRNIDLWTYINRFFSILAPRRLIMSQIRWLWPYFMTIFRFQTSPKKRQHRRQNPRYLIGSDRTSPNGPVWLQRSWGGGQWTPFYKNKKFYEISWHLMIFNEKSWKS